MQSERQGLSGDNHRSAGTPELRQIAGGGHTSLQLQPFSANDRAVIVRLHQSTLQASSSGTAAMACVTELARLAPVGKHAGLAEGGGVKNLNARRNQIR